MTDVCNMKTGIVLDGVAYEATELQYGCYLKGPTMWEFFPNADSEDVITIAAKRYRRNERIIKETAV